MDKGGHNLPAAQRAKCRKGLGEGTGATVEKGSFVLLPLIFSQLQMYCCPN
jgi:hypothetical protein